MTDDQIARQGQRRFLGGQLHDRLNAQVEQPAERLALPGVPQPQAMRRDLDHVSRPISTRLSLPSII